MDNRTEELAGGVWRIEAAPLVNVYLLANDGVGADEGLTLVDTGLKSSGPRVVRSVRMLGFDPRALRDVVLTHWHADHAGSAARFANSSAGTQVRVAAADLPMVRDGGPFQATTAGPADMTRAGRLFARAAGKPAAPVPDATALQAGEVLDVCGGAVVVPAAGHTAGHIALHLPSRGVLLAGDAVWNVWRLSRGPRFACSRLTAVPDTVRRLASLSDVGTLGVAHGRPVDRDVSARLATLIP